MENIKIRKKQWGMCECLCVCNLFMCTCVYVWVLYTSVKTLKDAKGIGSPGAGVTGNCKLPVLTSGNGTLTSRKARCTCNYSVAPPAPSCIYF